MEQLSGVLSGVLSGALFDHDNTISQYYIQYNTISQ